MTRRRQTAVARKLVAPRKKSNPIQEASNLMCAVLETLGFDLTDENFNGTPERFVRYLLEYQRQFNPAHVLKVDFSATHTKEQGLKGMVVQSNIPFRTICPHHLLPVLGHCHIGYIPSTRLVGISKLTRIVDAVGHQMPRMQETITDILADLLEQHLEAKGVMVVAVADHGCMTGRGVQVHNTPTATSTLRGLFRDVPAAKEEFFELLRMQSRG